jgi:hypothetical protein
VGSLIGNDHKSIVGKELCQRIWNFSRAVRYPAATISFANTICTIISIANTCTISTIGPSAGRLYRRPAGRQADPLGRRRHLPTPYPIGGAIQWRIDNKAPLSTHYEYIVGMLIVPIMRVVAIVGTGWVKSVTTVTTVKTGTPPCCIDWVGTGRSRSDAAGANEGVWQVEVVVKVEHDDRHANHFRRTNNPLWAY